MELHASLTRGSRFFYTGVAASIRGSRPTQPCPLQHRCLIGEVNAKNASYIGWVFYICFVCWETMVLMDARARYNVWGVHPPPYTLYNRHSTPFTPSTPFTLSRSLSHRHSPTLFDAHAKRQPPDHPERPIRTTQRRQHSALNTQHSTLNTQHSTLNTQHSTLNTQHSTLNRCRWRTSSSA